MFCGGGNVRYYRGDGGDVGADGGEVCFGADTGDEGLDGLDEAICLVFDVELFKLAGGSYLVSRNAYLNFLEFMVVVSSIVEPRLSCHSIRNSIRPIIRQRNIRG